MLSVRDLRAGYGKAQILHGVSLTVERGAITALLGANGAGKTTLLRTIAGLVPATAGDIALAGRTITRQRSSERVEQGIALVPEGRLLFPTLTVAQNLRLGAVTRRARAGWSERIREMYALFPRLAERSSQAASTLSGGEQQMLAIARGLMSRPEVLLLDEPTWGLAPIMCELIFETITRLSRDGLTVLLAEQNVTRALELASSGYVVENGHIAASGTSAALLDDPRVKAAYLGR